MGLTSNAPMDIESIRSANFRRVVYLSLCFMMLLTAFIAAQNLMGPLYKQMGFESLPRLIFFCMFTGIIASSLVSNHYYKKVSLKVCLALGAASHVAFLFSGLLVSFCNKKASSAGMCSGAALYTINGMSAVLLGCGISFIWLAQARYVNLCADEATRGKFNGVFWAVSQICQVLSACLGTFVLGSFDVFTFYMILTGFGIFAVMMLMFVQPPVPYNDAPETEKNESLKESLRVFSGAAKKPAHFWLFAAIIFSGVATNFYASSFGKLTGDTTTPGLGEKEKNKLTGYVLIVLAIGEVLSGISMGSLADKMNKVSLLGFTIIVNQIGLVLTFLGYDRNSYYIMLFTGFFWGFGDTAINTMLGIIIGSKYNSRTEMFSCLKFFQASGGLITSVVGMAFEKNPVPFFICVGALMLICQAGFYGLYPRNAEKQEKYLLSAHDTETETGSHVVGSQTDYTSL